MHSRLRLSLLQPRLEKEEHPVYRSNRCGGLWKRRNIRSPTTLVIGVINPALSQDCMLEQPVNSSVNFTGLVVSSSRGPWCYPTVLRVTLFADSNNSVKICRLRRFPFLVVRLLCRSKINLHSRRKSKFCRRFCLSLPHKENLAFPPSPREGACVGGIRRIGGFTPWKGKGENWFSGR